MSCWKRPPSFGSLNGQRSSSSTTSTTHSRPPSSALGGWGSHFTCTQKTPCIIFSSMTTGPQSWQLEHSKPCTDRSSQCREESSLKSSPAPSKQLSRQKNSTNSRVEVRWLNILSAFFWVYNISPSHPCYLECKTLAKRHHTICTHS